MEEVTLVIETDLHCEKCYKKIQKVLCKLKEREKIRTINFDVKKNEVTISGPFDQVKLSRKLRCRACEAIKDIRVKKKEADKKPDEKKPAAEKKPEEKKPAEEKKPEEKKPEEIKKPAEEVKKPADEKPKQKEEAKAAAPPPAPSTTVNLQFTQICTLCYPWPCSDPSHWGGVHQYPQQAKPQPQPQPQWPCEGMPPTAVPAFPGYHQHQQPCQPQPWAPTTPNRTCGGPAYCGGGCGSCGGGGGGGMQHGWPPAMPTPVQMMQPPPMCSSGGPSSCRGCKGCRIVQEGRFIYEEYPQNSCAVM